MVAKKTAMAEGFSNEKALAIMLEVAEGSRGSNLGGWWRRRRRRQSNAIGNVIGNVNPMIIAITIDFVVD